MLRPFRAVVTIVASLVLPLAASASSAQPDPANVALGYADALQSDARVLRNGARAGADAETLSREAARLKADLEGLIAAHRQWEDTLSSERRQALVAALREINAGCEQMRERLAALDQTLSAIPLDRASVQTAGRAIGRRARLCANALRDAVRR